MKVVKLLMLTLLFSLAWQLAYSQKNESHQYVRYEDGGVIFWGELDGSTIHQLSAAPYLDGNRTGKSVKREAVKLKAPGDPRHMFGTAWNFRSHLGNREPSKYPTVFLVPGNTLVGPQDPIVRHRETTRLAYEAEMAVVIGKRAENVSIEDAPNYIFAVTAGNDVTDRAWQGADNDWLRAKGARGFNAIGPVIVTGLDYNKLEITGKLNGEEVQRGNTSDLLFNMNEMVSWISHYFTLEPGDMVWTGTMGTPRFLEPGDTFEVEVEGVGILKNLVVQGE
jgi:2-keto-4-pentenoate hydratase/2-oxohepta-3-ene-1,7-dioic acid hydratase in catechol pathway